MGISFLIVYSFLIFQYQGMYAAALPTMSTAEDTFVMSRPQTHALFTIALVYTQDSVYDDALRVQSLLKHTGIFDIHLIKSTVSIDMFPGTKQDIIHYLHKGFSGILFIQREEDALCWRLYDTTSADMLIGKKIGHTSGMVMARLIADKVYTYLFNKPSYFLTKIAYIKKTPTLSQKKRTELCIVDPVNGVSDVLLHDNRTLVAPQWALSQKDNRMFLYVSECTPRNVRLLGVDLSGSVWSVLDGDGTYVGVAPKDSATYVYVRSGVIWLYSFDTITKKGTHKRLTSPDSICACPSLTSSGDIIYSSNNKVYRYDSLHATHSVLPMSGSCIAPDVHRITDRIVFSRMVNGVVQLHTVDILGKNVKQLTYGPGNKSDACWSPCGNYIAYVRSERGKEQIAVFNCITSRETILTPDNQLCGYPSWSANNPHLYR